MIEWTEEYAVGVKDIDDQHRRLFEIADQAYTLLRKDLQTDKFDRIVEIFEELKDYTVYHFNFEESYMAGIGYPKILSHKVEHSDFIEKVNGVDYRQIDDNQNQYLMEILNFVVDWIKSHIKERDKKIALG
jgi:hemerythrin